MDVLSFLPWTSSPSGCNKAYVEVKYEKNGYPFQAQFLDEYVEKMSSIGENLCCYDLQAAAILFKD